jgi:hypothetical protein
MRLEFREAYGVRPARWRFRAVLALDGFLDCDGQLVEGLALRMRPDLKRRAHRKSPLACTVLSGRNFGAGQFELGFDLVRKLELVFAELIEPLLKVRQFLCRELRDGSLNFLHCAHTGNLAVLGDM